MTVRVGSKAAAVAGVAAFSLVLAACGSDDDGDASATGDAGGAVAEDCPAEVQEILDDFGDLSGEEVYFYTSITGTEDQPYIDSFVPFEECSGAEVVFEGTQEFESQLIVRIQSGNPPDMALFPQPGLLETIVNQTGAVLPASAEVEALTDEGWAESFKPYGTVEDTFYAAPVSTDMKSFVWYSPSIFEENGYEIPETWDEMIALTDQMIADYPDVKPWCAGIFFGDASGWPATDWMEDLMLRLHGRDVYDQWITNELPFNSPEVAEALEYAGQILKNPDYVNGGFGDVQTVATTDFRDAGQPILNDECFLHRQASFYQANWPEGTTVAEDGDVFAFYMPVLEQTEGTPILMGGTFAARFVESDAAEAFQRYLATPYWANEKIKLSGQGWISANKGVDVANLVSPIDVLATESLTDPEAIVGFDASDLMPGEVGTGSFWTQMIEWIANDKSDEDVLNAIQDSWPSS